MYEFDGYRLDPNRRQLQAPGGDAVVLLPKAIDTLLYLVEHAGQNVSKDELIEAVWPNTVVEENNLAQAISALRKALGEKTGEHRFIVTIPGRGYRFVAKVTTLASATDRSPLLEPLPADAPPQSATTRRLRLWMGVAATLIAVAIVTLVLSIDRTQDPPTRPSTTATTTIAVLPFKPLVASETNESMELGMADSLILELSRSAHLIVRPLNATRRFNSLDQDPVAAGRDLGVDAVLDGTVQIAEERVRASARLLRVADGHQLWAGKFDERFTGIFQVQDAIAQRVADALTVRLSPRVYRDTDNLLAYEHYAKGRMHAMRLVLPEARRAVEYFERAILEDPTYALPHAGLAEALRSFVLSNDIAPAEVIPRATIAALRAIELAPNLAEANQARGMIAFMFERDWRTAETHLARAVEVAPNSAEAHIYLAHLYSNLGRKSEALSHARRARELNPVSPLVGALEAEFLFHHGDRAAAMRRVNDVIGIEPGFWLSHHLLSDILIADARYDASLQASAEAKRLSPLQNQSDALRAIALAGLGRTQEARAILSSLEQAARDRYVPPTYLAWIHLALGDHDAALRQLEAALIAGDVWLSFLKVDPKWNRLRADPRFARILRQAGFD